MTRTSLIVLAVALLAQCVLAPGLSLFGIVPNIVLVILLVMALRDTSSFFFVAAFLAGLLLDCMGNGPLGAYALLCMVETSIAKRVLTLIDNGTLFMSLLVVALSIVFVELSYALILAGTGMLGDILGALVFFALPASIYNCALASIALPLAYKFLSPAQTPGSDALPRVQLR